MASLFSTFFGGGATGGAAPTFIGVAEASDLVKQGAALVDVREAGEFAAERIPGSVNAPLSRLAPQSIGQDAKAVVFFCASGARTRMSAGRLAAAALAPAYVMDGGISAWKRAGLKTAR
jgi:rhodanese-related sulfurtransferase